MKLIEDLKGVLGKERISVHMPGHKYRGLPGVPLSEDWHQIDTTEITGTDNLHAPRGILKEAMDRGAAAFGAKQTLFLVNGSTIGVLAAIMGATNRGDAILMGRDCHKSVYSAIQLKDLREVVVMPRVGQTGEMLGYEPSDFLEALEAAPDIKVVILTSPTYYGFVTDLEVIAERLNARGGTLIVDEAHGAHLYFGKLAHLGALSQGAHVVVQSAHKMLPAMTQTGLLHLGKNINARVEGGIIAMLSMLHTTSPSYVFLASIDSAITYMAGAVSRAEGLMDAVCDLRRTRFQGWLGKTPDDPMKLWLATEQQGFSGSEVADYLESVGIVPEFSLPQGVLCYLSAMNTEADLNGIADALDALKAQAALEGRQPLEGLVPFNLPKPQRIMTQSQVDGAIAGGEEGPGATFTLPLTDSVGYISGVRVVPYPPGVPLLLPGELITIEHIQILHRLSDRHVVLGLENKQNQSQLRVLKGDTHGFTDYHRGQ